MSIVNTYIKINCLFSILCQKMYLTIDFAQIILYNINITQQHFYGCYVETN